MIFFKQSQSWTLAPLLLLLFAAPLVGVAAERPNVVFILADDLGWRDLSVEGSEFYESPNVDRIANEGMRFTRGYATCQVCSPSRASIMTGKYPARLAITDWIGAAAGTDWKRNTRLLPAQYNRHLPHKDISLAEAFREGGYRTFFAGKWHLGGQGSFPEDHGFEVNVGGHHRGSPPGGFFSICRSIRFTRRYKRHLSCGRSTAGSPGRDHSLKADSSSIAPPLSVRFKIIPSTQEWSRRWMSLSEKY